MPDQMHCMNFGPSTCNLQIPLNSFSNRPYFYFRDPNLPEKALCYHYGGTGRNFDRDTRRRFEH